MRALPDAASVLTLHDSNNHYLNTLWFYAVGDTAPAWCLRLPAWLAGCASVGLGAALAWRRGRLEALFASVALAASFALVHFSSEARGYAMVVMFALAAQLALEADLARPRMRTALAFAACAVLGLLSQLIFVFYWAGALAIALVPAPAAAAPGAAPAARAARRAGARARHAPCDRPAQAGRRGRQPHRSAAADHTECRLCARAADRAHARDPVCGCGARPHRRGALAACARCRRQLDPVRRTILVAPIAVFAWLRPEVIAERYFLIGIAFALLLCADLAAVGWRAGGATARARRDRRRGVRVGQRVVAFARHGRGGFRAALLEMAARTPGPRVEVGSDHDFRNGQVLAYYVRALPPGKQLVYIPRARWPHGGPQWFVRHAAQRPARPATRIEASGARYRLVAEYDHAAISGFYWAVYQREFADAR